MASPYFFKNPRFLRNPKKTIRAGGASTVTELLTCAPATLLFCDVLDESLIYQLLNQRVIVEILQSSPRGLIGQGILDRDGISERHQRRILHKIIVGSCHGVSIFQPCIFLHDAKRKVLVLRVNMEPLGKRHDEL